MGVFVPRSHPALLRQPGVDSVMALGLSYALKLALAVVLVDRGTVQAVLVPRSRPVLIRPPICLNR